LLVLNCDVLFHPAILERLLLEPGDRIAFGSSTGHSPEDMSVKVGDGRLLAMSKDLPASEVSGENVGILCFTAETARALFTRAESLVAAGGERNWLASAVERLAQERVIHAVDIRGLPWQEIDFAEDLHRAREQVYPLLESSGACAT
jgi:choline kinase